MEIDHDLGARRRHGRRRIRIDRIAGSSALRPDVGLPFAIGDRQRQAVAFCRRSPRGACARVDLHSGVVLAEYGAAERRRQHGPATCGAGPGVHLGVADCGRRGVGAAPLLGGDRRRAARAQDGMAEQVAAADHGHRGRAVLGVAVRVRAGDARGRRPGVAVGRAPGAAAGHGESGAVGAVLQLGPLAVGLADVDDQCA